LVLVVVACGGCGDHAGSHFTRGILPRRASARPARRHDHARPWRALPEAVSPAAARRALVARSTA
jgi:hypothetical protein